MENKRIFIVWVFVFILLLVVFMAELTTFPTAPPPRPVPSPLMEGLRNKIFASDWIQLFPKLKKMVQVVDDRYPVAMTNANNTSIKILNLDNLQVGGTLKARITSYNEAGEKKTYGGDFFAVILRRPRSTIDGVTCEIADETNGSYSVSCILPWYGAAIVEAKLIHPGETIYQLMKTCSSEKELGRYQGTTILNSKNMEEFTACSIGFPDKRYRPHLSS